MACTICMIDNNLQKCPVCGVDVCVECMQTYCAVQLKDNKLPNCANPDCTYIYMPKYMKNNGMKELSQCATNVILANNSNITSMIMSRIETMRAVERARQHVRKLKERFIEQLPCGLQAISTIVSGKIFKKRERREIAKIGTVETQMIECPKYRCGGHICTRGDLYVCDVCESPYCSQCKEIHDVGVKCNEQTLKNLEMIKKETVECPRCKTSIYRTAGCDHMLCVKCGAKFNYATGEIDKFFYNHPEQNNMLHASNSILSNKTLQWADERVVQLSNVFKKNITSLKLNRGDALKTKLKQSKISKSQFDDSFPKAYEKDYFSKQIIKHLTLFLTYFDEYEMRKISASEFIDKYTELHTILKNAFYCKF